MKKKTDLKKLEAENKTKNNILICQKHSTIKFGMTNFVHEDNDGTSLLC